MYLQILSADKLSACTLNSRSLVTRSLTDHCMLDHPLAPSCVLYSEFMHSDTSGCFLRPTVPPSVPPSARPTASAEREENPGPAGLAARSLAFYLYHSAAAPRPPLSLLVCSQSTRTSHAQFLPFLPAAWPSGLWNSQFTQAAFLEGAMTKK